MGVLEAIRYIQTDITGVMSGIQDAPQDAIESVDQYPFAISYLEEGEIEFMSAGWARIFPTIITEFHLSSNILAEAVQSAMTYFHLFVQALIADPTLGDNISTIVSASFLFGRLEWGGDKNIGLRFRLHVKLHDQA